MTPFLRRPKGHRDDRRPSFPGPRWTTDREAAPHVAGTSSDGIGVGRALTKRGRREMFRHRPQHPTGPANAKTAIRIGGSTIPTRGRTADSIARFSPYSSRSA